MGAWIETRGTEFKAGILGVAPRVGAWIETLLSMFTAKKKKSRPAWARGLKRRVPVFADMHEVSPRVGAWIETLSRPGSRNCDCVAPHVGAWIEPPSFLCATLYLHVLKHVLK